MRGIALVAIVGAVGCVALLQKLSGMQEQLARQSADTSVQATEARAVARQAQELAMETAAKQSVMEGRVSEVTLQRINHLATAPRVQRSDI
jgi:uroporphyrin-3 C-methyltransferase